MPRRERDVLRKERARMLPAHGTLAYAILNCSFSQEEGDTSGKGTTHAFGRPIRLVGKLDCEVNSAAEAATCDA